MNIIYKANRSVIFYLISLLAVMAFFFKPDFDLDIYRYYTETPSIARTPIFEYIIDCIYNYSDFMYRVTLIFFYNLGAPLEVVNALYVGSYYFLIYKIVSEYLSIQKIKLSRSYELTVLVASIFSVLPILVFSVSRMLSGIVVFYIGLLYILRRKYVCGTLFLVISLTFHLGMILFLFLLIILWCINRIDISKHLNNSDFRFITLLLMVFLPLFFFHLYFPLIQSFVFQTGIFGNHPYQEIYLSGGDGSQSNSIFNHGMWYIRYGEPLSLLIMFFSLVNIRQREVVNYGIFFIVIYSAFLGSLCFLGDRMMMIMPVLYGIIMSNVIYERRIMHKKTTIFILLMLFFTAFNIFNFYTCRTVFFGMH